MKPSDFIHPEDASALKQMEGTRNETLIRIWWTE